MANEELARIASVAALKALQDWTPTAADSLDRLAQAIGDAVAAGIRRHEEYAARHTALAMAGEEEDTGEEFLNWQV